MELYCQAKSEFEEINKEITNANEAEKRWGKILDVLGQLDKERIAYFNRTNKEKRRERWPNERIRQNLDNPACYPGLVARKIWLKTPTYFNEKEIGKEIIQKAEGLQETLKEIHLDEDRGNLGDMPLYIEGDGFVEAYNELWPKIVGEN